MKPTVHIDPRKLEVFERAFSSHTSGCVRECRCGKTYYHDDEGGYSWEPGELERLAKSGARALDYSPGGIVIDGVEFVNACDCWHPQAAQIISFVDANAHPIAEYLSLEKKRKQQEADAAPVVR